MKFHNCLHAKIGEGFEKELEGVVVQRAQRVDRFVTKELMNNLFNSKKLSKLKKVNLQGEIEIQYKVTYILYGV